MPTKTKRKPLTAAQDPAKQTKLWKLLRIGLRDLRKHERTKGCVVEMGIWLSSNGSCRACLAGSVLRHTLNRKQWTFSSTYSNWMLALDALRTGRVGVALWRISAIEYCGHKLDRDMPDYDERKMQWWKAARQLLADLKAADI